MSSKCCFKVLEPKTSQAITICNIYVAYLIIHDHLYQLLYFGSLRIKTAATFFEYQRIHKIRTTSLNKKHYLSVQVTMLFLVLTAHTSIYHIMSFRIIIT